MTDARLLPANGRVAGAELQGTVEADRFVAGEVCRIISPVADLWVDPVVSGLDRQVLLGDRFRVLERRDGLAFGQSDRGGYCGYVRETDLGGWSDPTHTVTVRSTLAFAEPSIKHPNPIRLSIGARIASRGVEGDFIHTSEGFIPSKHLREISDHDADPVSVAQKLLGAPYLWGGNSADGIDCSGLVQMALRACGLDCPGDSDQQRAAFKEVQTPQRGDLIFWQGHVAMCVDGDTLIHANAHHMAVSLEDRAACVARIQAAENKPILKISRPMEPA